MLLWYSLNSVTVLFINPILISHLDALSQYWILFKPTVICFYFHLPQLKKKVSRGRLFKMLHRRRGEEMSKIICISTWFQPAISYKYKYQAINKQERGGYNCHTWISLNWNCTQIKASQPENNALQSGVKSEELGATQHCHFNFPVSRELSPNYWTLHM